MKATAIKERPILMSGPMVRATLAKLKTQTRRVIVPQPVPSSNLRDMEDAGPKQYFVENGVLRSPARHGSFAVPCPFGEVGDRLWVREAFYIDTRNRKDMTPQEVIYAATPEIAMDHTGKIVQCRYIDNEYVTREAAERNICTNKFWKKKSSIHMPRWASRITLEITEVRVQRLQGISEEDAKAEGLLAQAGDGTGPGAGYKWNGVGYHGAGFGKYGPTFHVSGPQSKKCVCNVGGPTPAQCAFRELWDSINGKRSPWSANEWVWALTFKRLEQP